MSNLKKFTSETKDVSVFIQELNNPEVKNTLYLRWIIAIFMTNVRIEELSQVIELVHISKEPGSENAIAEIKKSTGNDGCPDEALSKERRQSFEEQLQTVAYGKTQREKNPVPTQLEN